MRASIITILLLMLPVISTMYIGCEGFSLRHCPPFVKGKKWQVIDIKSGNTSSLAYWKNKLGGDLIIEFQKRGMRCRVHAYVKQTGKLLYGSKKNEPILRAHICRGQKNWKLEFEVPPNEYLLDSFPVFITNNYGWIYLIERSEDTLLTSKASLGGEPCILRIGDDILILKKM